MVRIFEWARAQSEQGAIAVQEEIFAKLAFLEIAPEGAPVDPNAPAFPQPEAKGRRAIAGNYEILYAFPVAYEGDDETVAILFVRDARRDLLDRAEIRQRFVDLSVADVQGPDAITG